MFIWIILSKYVKCKLVNIIQAWVNLPSGCLTAACPSLTRVIIIHLQFIKGSLSSDFLKNCKDVKPNFEAIILFMK
jgi:hypothetical protein